MARRAPGEARRWRAGHSQRRHAGPHDGSAVEGERGEQQRWGRGARELKRGGGGVGGVREGGGVLGLGYSLLGWWSFFFFFCFSLLTRLKWT